ncbi:uncharacterized protein YALI1_C13910g [Yarrowia lipolytica]|uniref:Uncharacterized protein n=1 Tax=Yarrowia lipolytica TaxID=4952 RepID=A0A1D8NAF8_YARLL|nr:hypothetical protein YALI1_C13910g [Yarrowia lipolytica]
MKRDESKWICFFLKVDYPPFENPALGDPSSSWCSTGCESTASIEKLRHLTFALQNSWRHPISLSTQFNSPPHL